METCRFKTQNLRSSSFFCFTKTSLLKFSVYKTESRDNKIKLIKKILIALFNLIVKTYKESSKLLKILPDKIVLQVYNQLFILITFVQPHNIIGFKQKKKNKSVLEQQNQKVIFN